MGGLCAKGWLGLLDGWFGWRWADLDGTFGCFTVVPGTGLVESKS